MTIETLPRRHFDGFAKLARDTGVSPDFQEIVVELSQKFAKYQKIGSPAVSETVFHRCDERTQKIEECFFITGDNVTAHDVNYAILTVRKRNVDGTDAGTIFYAETTTSGTGNWVANTAVPIPELSGALSGSYKLAKGESLSFETTIAGTGVVVPAGILMAFYR